MERNKWEDEFKNKLNQREITPTPHAWDRLDAMLNESDSKNPVVAQQKPVRKLDWLYIAAGIAAFLVTAIVFFTQEKEKQLNEVVIEESQTPQQIERNVPIDSAEPIQPQIQIVEQDVEQVRNEGSFKMNGQKPTQMNSNIQPNVIQSNSVQIAEVVIKNPKSQISVVSPINETPGNDPQIASAEMTSPKSVKVDPRSLLSQVDGELDMTFREKTLKKIGKKYQNVKVALANRNNQEE